MADEDHGQAVVGQPAHQPQHLLGLGDAQGGGRLVEDDQLGVPEHRPGDGHRLPLATGQGGHQRADRLQGPDGQPVERLPGAGLHRVLVQRRGAAELTTEEHVLDHIQVVAEREVLVDDLDPERVGVAGPVDGHGLALEEVLTLVEAVDPGDALDQRALAGAVVAHQRGDLAAAYVEVHTAEHMDGPEALLDATQAEDRRVVGAGIPRRKGLGGH